MTFGLAFVRIKSIDLKQQKKVSMSSIVLAVILFLSFPSCTKQYHKAENENIRTVERLNEGNYASVISELGPEANTLGSDKRYYLAAAYSQEGNVDLHSLYHVMEIQLFHKKALEWSDISKDKNPYLKFLKGQSGVDLDKRTTKLQKNWDKYESRLKIKMGFHEKKSLKEINSRGLNASQQIYDKVDSDLAKKTQEIILLDLEKMDIPPEEFFGSNDLPGKRRFLLRKFINEYGERWSTERSVGHELAWHYASVMDLEEAKHNFLYPKKKSDQFNSVKWEIVYMNILWNTYEAIPIMRRLPTLTFNQQDSVTKALDLYFSLLDNPEYKEVAFKNIIVLSSVSLLSIYKDSFDLESVTSVQDLLCWFDPVGLLDNYSLIHKRLFFLQDSIEKSGFRFKDHENYKVNLEAIKKDLPENLSEFERERYIKSVDDYKVDSCIKT